jgi:hypothetical protein
VSDPISRLVDSHCHIDLWSSRAFTGTLNELKGAPESGGNTWGNPLFAAKAARGRRVHTRWTLRENLAILLATD